MPVENNETNKAKLAAAVVEQADYGEVYEMAINACYDLYEIDDDKFQEDWESIFGERE